MEGHGGGFRSQRSFRCCEKYGRCPHLLPPRRRSNWIPYKSESTILNKSKIVEGRDRGAFVCVTGQTSRLEIESKVRSILHPLAERFSYVDLAFILDSKSSFLDAVGESSATRYDSPNSVRSV